MRARIYGMLVTLGLVATSLAQAGDMGKLKSMTPDVELVIDTSVHPFDSRYAVPRQSASSWARSVQTTFSQPEFTGLDVALSSPGILFGVPHDFYTSRCISPTELPPGWFSRGFSNRGSCTP
jgi:hypothetical protein